MKKIYKLKKLIEKVFCYIRKKVFFLNISNKNLQNLAYREFCYKKLEKKYRKVVNNFSPVESTISSSNKVWFCWLQGLENAPELVRKCYKSIKTNMPDKEIVVLTSENFLEYVSFPEYIMEKYKKGFIENAHFSDLIRLEVLNKYGGLWIDSTVLVTDKIEDTFFYNDLFVFKNISLYQKEQLAVSASNWLIYTKSNNNNILNLTEKLLLEYWKRSNYAVNYHIFHLFFTMATKKFDKEWNSVPSYSNIAPHILQFELSEKYTSLRWNQIKRMSNFHKLNHRFNTNNVDSFYYKLINGELENE